MYKLTTSTILTLSIFLHFDTCLSSDPYFLTCPPKLCGDVNITYPFRVPGQQKDHCGYPGFEISCPNDATPIINISGNTYMIQQIWYKNQSFQVKNAFFGDPIGYHCKGSIGNLSLDNGVFNLARRYAQMALFLNCPPRLLGEYKEGLLGCGTLGLYESDVRLKRLEGVCGSTISVPFEGENGSNLKEVLERGFVLNWTANNCSACVDSGGQCGFDVQTKEPKCFCEDTAHAYDCLPLSKKHSLKWAIGGLVVFCMVSIAIILCLLWRCRGQENEAERNILALESQESPDELIQGHRNDLRLLKYANLVNATKNFHQSHQLGKGGFGEVYMGKLKDGQEIAVKRLSACSGQGIKEFTNEVVVISKLQHRNLVKLVGFCTKGEEKMLVYEYMPNKSLDAFLFDSMKREVLDWGKRFNIIQGICRGLIYLHRDSRLRIIHRDLKASNILLDEDLNPKISDFGMARIFMNNQDEDETKRVVGTYGYMAPEYAMEGQFSEKSDVYSFGVLVLEIVTAQKSNTFWFEENALSLLGFAWKLWAENNMTAIIDPIISDQAFRKDIERCIQVGLLCVQEYAKDRPSTTTILSMLTSEIVDLPPPKKPGMSKRLTTLDPATASSSSGTASFTVTHLTCR